MPLTAENRILTALGLRRLQSRARPGVAALLAAAGVDLEREVDARTVAWKLAPRINAPGRLGAAEPSLALLLADADTAAARAQVLEAANAERRTIQDRVMAEALAQLGDRGSGPGDRARGRGLAGRRRRHRRGQARRSLPASRVRRSASIRRPASAAARRAPRGGVNLYARCRRRARARSAARPVRRSRGGGGLHAPARVGRGARRGARRARAASSPKARGPVTARAREIDAEVRLAEVDERLAHELAGLGPFGQHNPAPVLVTRNARVTAVRRVGDTDGPGHLKLTLEDDHSTIRSAIGFGLGDRPVEVGDAARSRVRADGLDVAGRRSAELELHDLAPTNLAPTELAPTELAPTTS